MTVLLQLSDVKAHLRIDTTADDNLLTIYVAVAVDTVQQYLNRNLYAPGDTIPTEDTTGITLPDSVKGALLLYVAHFYENREPIVAERGVIPTEIPKTIDWLLAPYRYYPLPTVPAWPDWTPCP